MPTNPRPAPRGSELPADRLLGPAIFFLLGATLAILGVRGAPAPSDLAPERGVASPPALKGNRIFVPPAGAAEGAEWVAVPEVDLAEPVSEGAADSGAPVPPTSVPSTLSRGGGSPPPRVLPSREIQGAPGRSPPQAISPL
jgi:hypothetical protein